jgi:peptidoglycan hydrolase-like protein with peptidoglycan-binding domain
VAGSVLVTAVITLGLITATIADGGAADTTDTTQALATVVVQQRDLELYDTTTATLEFVASATVMAPSGGTVTAMVAEGDTVTAGTTVAAVDGEPVVALYGDVPSWRDLDTSSTDGVDVYQLETNLVALGFDPDGAITIDGTFDAATEAAVEAWNESLGLDESAVPQSRVSWIPGDLLVDSLSTGLGSTISEGDALLTGRLTDRVFLTPATVDGDGSGITPAAATAATATTGTVLFFSDGWPVVAAVGDVATLARNDRDLSTASDAGADVALLESALSAAGFDAGGALVVDDTFDDTTAEATADWFRSLGLTIDDDSAVEVPAGSLVVVPSGLSVGEAIVTDGGVTIPRLTSAARVVRTTAPLDDDTFAPGAEVTVEYPDGTLTVGEVTEVGTTATNSSGEPGGQATVEVSIEVEEVPESVAGFVEVPVSLSVLTDTIAGAHVVPTSALVALAEGGYALEVADSDGGTRLIAVEPGTYQDGFVEVTGADVTAGLEVVVPS